MISFWFIIALMTLLALGFVLFPLLHKQTNTTLESSNLNLALYKMQLSQLDEQFKAAEINLADYQIAHQELTLALLEDVPEKKSVFQNDPSYWLALTFLIILPIIALVLYFSWGNSRLLAQSLQIKQQAELVRAEMIKLGSVKNIINTLQQKLKQNPQSAQGWYLMGRLYLSQQQLSAALSAFTKANQLQPNDTNIMLQYAETLFFLNHNSLNHQAKTLIQKVLQQSPDEMNAVNLLALNAYYQGNYQQAINYWRSLLEKMPAQQEDSKVLSTMIAKAQHHLMSRKLKE